MRFSFFENMFVVFLRWINVWWKNKINMKTLENDISKLWFSNIKTYINTGNILFESSFSIEQIKYLIENKIKEIFNLKIDAFVFSKDYLNFLAKNIPEDWMQNKIFKTDVVFLNDKIDIKEFENILPKDDNIENILFLENVLIWNIKYENYVKSKIPKFLFQTKNYKNLTIRNINTIRKINELV